MRVDTLSVLFINISSASAKSPAHIALSKQIFNKYIGEYAKKCANRL